METDSHTACASYNAVYTAHDTLIYYSHSSNAEQLTDHPSVTSFLKIVGRGERDRSSCTGTSGDTRGKGSEGLQIRGKFETN